MRLFSQLMRFYQNKCAHDNILTSENLPSSTSNLKQKMCVVLLVQNNVLLRSKKCSSVLCFKNKNSWRNPLDLLIVQSSLDWWHLLIASGTGFVSFHCYQRKHSIKVNELLVFFGGFSLLFVLLAGVYFFIN